MSSNLRRTLISSTVFFSLFLALCVGLQYQNEDFSFHTALSNTFFVTMLYTGFTWLIRRVTGSKGSKK